ncbi:unnamed protein product [Lymnaea stagnalis]|uniref:Transmembrane protein 185A n=1 Tax=Lymnaea stagnalis TaxID=6523 RepID=A0AAV2IM74_LYMST
MNLKNLFQDFNPSKFVVFTCLLVFTVLFSLRLDKSITWSYWFVFLPIWVWKLLVMIGAFIGSSVWLRNPQYRQEASSANQYKAMIVSCGEHLALLMFELLVVINLESDGHNWLIVFIPLFILSVFCIGACIWCVKNDRSCELELFCAVNILQFIFLALRLDNIIVWSWVIVFIPIWIIMCVAMIGVLYAVALAIILLRSPDILSEQRRGNVSTAIGYSFLVIPLLVFEILLANRLDHMNDFNFITVAVPLVISLVSLICLAFGAKGGNCWWFGIRKDFCQFLLGVCPCLQEYGNISYSIQSNDHDPQPRSPAEEHSDHSLPEVKVKLKGKEISDEPRQSIPVLSMESPD